MTKRTVVYAVERGDYSDYSVLALFVTRADAEQVADRVGGDVVAREVYASVPARVNYWFIDRFPPRRDGSAETPTLKSVLREHWDGPPFEGSMVRGVAFQRWSYGPGQKAVRVWGTDKAGVMRRWQEFLDSEAAARGDV